MKYFLCKLLFWILETRDTNDLTKYVDYHYPILICKQIINEKGEITYNICQIIFRLFKMYVEMLLFRRPRVQNFKFLNEPITKAGKAHFLSFVNECNNFNQSASSTIWLVGIEFWQVRCITFWSLIVVYVHLWLLLGYYSLIGVMKGILKYYISNFLMTNHVKHRK